MTELLKIIAIAIIATISIFILKPIKPEFAILISVVSGVIILLMIVFMFTDVWAGIESIFIKTGIDQNLFFLLLKVVGIGYLTEFAANVCEDSGNSSLANKVLLGGKVLILLVSLPILTGIIDIIGGLTK